MRVSLTFTGVVRQSCTLATGNSERGGFLSLVSVVRTGKTFGYSAVELRWACLDAHRFFGYKPCSAFHIWNPTSAANDIVPLITVNSGVCRKTLLTVF
jgi:hypothetical protein